MRVPELFGLDLVPPLQAISFKVHSNLGVMSYSNNNSSITWATKPHQIIGPPCTSHHQLLPNSSPTLPYVPWKLHEFVSYQSRHLLLV